MIVVVVLVVLVWVVGKGLWCYCGGVSVGGGCGVVCLGVTVAMGLI